MISSRAIVLCVAILLSLGSAGTARAQAAGEVAAAITEYSNLYGVPESLVHRREREHIERAHQARHVLAKTSPDYALLNAIFLNATA